MSVGLLAPAALTALLALAIPLLLHLARRSDERRTVFAALRWLREKPKPRQRLRFDEWPLLLVRLLLLAALALLLARPALLGTGNANAPWWVVVPGVSRDALPRIDDKAELHWLAPGFPKIDATGVDRSVAFPTLLRELDAQLPASTKLGVIVPEQLAGADAQRIALSREVEWKVVPGALPHVEADNTPLQLDVSQLPADAAGVKYLRAVNAAWKPDAGKVATIRVLLASQPAPAGLRFHPALRNAQGETLAETARAAGAAWLRFTRELSPAAMPELLDADFPARLHAAVLPAPQPSRAFARDYAPVRAARNDNGVAPDAHELHDAFALLVVLLFALERWLATRRTRATPP